MANSVVWVDIPVLDLDRAMRFYSAVLGAELTKQEFPGMTIALLPGYESDVSGCLFVKEDETPSRHRPTHLSERARTARRRNRRG